MMFCEFRIFENDIEKQLDIVRGLYRDFLRFDETFHYLLEPGYLLIRTDVEYARPHTERLAKSGLTFDYRDTWKEECNQGVVSRYGDFFAVVFHQLSILALSGVTADDLSAISERVVHCFHDMNNMLGAEVATYARLLIDRSYTAGFLNGQMEKNDPD
jgi:hypothetical protein